MADTPNGETVTPGDSQTTVPTTTTPPPDNGVDTAEVERLRKEKEQAEMRARQLQNQLDAQAKAEEEARQKQLEENNEWKTIAEQNQAKLEEIAERERKAEAQAELESAKAEILLEFPDGVAEAAKDLDLTLNENSEEAKEAFKTKLNKLSEKVSSDSRVTPSNGNTTTKSLDRHELMVEHAKKQTIAPGDSPVYHEALGQLNWIQQAKAVNGDE